MSIAKTSVGRYLLLVVADKRSELAVSHDPSSHRQEGMPMLVASVQGTDAASRSSHHRVLDRRGVLVGSQ